MVLSISDTRFKKYNHLILFSAFDGQIFRYNRYFWNFYKISRYSPNFSRLPIFHFIVENYGNRYMIGVKVAEIEENGGFQTPSLEI